MKIAWRDLFTYSSISPPPPPPPLVPVKLHCGRSLIPWDKDGRTHPFQIQTKTQLPKNSLFNQHQWLFSLLHLFHRSFSLVIHKSAKCPFQAAHKHPHRSSKMPPHSEARAADGSEPTAVQLPTVRKWWMSEWMCILQSARQCRWFLGWGLQVN